MGLGDLVRTRLSFSRRSRSQELKWDSYSEVTVGDENSVKDSVHERLVEIFDIEEEVEIKKPISVAEAVEAVLSFENEDAKEVADEGSSASINIIDRTPSKLKRHESVVPRPKEEEVAESQYLAPKTDTQAPRKSRYTKEEKQKRFIKELFNLSNMHMDTGDDLRDDSSIVSSAVGSVSSLPPPTTKDTLLRLFDCSNTCGGQTLYKESFGSIFFKAARPQENTDALRAASVIKKSDEEDDESLDEALAAISKTPAENVASEPPGVVNMPIASPITVTSAPEDVASVATEVINGDEQSAVSVKYSVRHVTSNNTVNF
jgi:hypothetical protein